MTSLISVYSATPQNYSYLLAATDTSSPGPPANQPWAAVYIQSRGQQAATFKSLPDVFRAFKSPNPGFSVMLFCHFGASAAPNAQQIGRALDAITDWSTITGRTGTSIESGAVVWIADPAAITQATLATAPRLPLRPIPPGRQPTPPDTILDMSQNRWLLALAPGQAGGENLYLLPGGSDVHLDSNGPGDALQLRCDQGLKIARGVVGGALTPIADAGTTIAIPIGASLNGCLKFDGTLGVLDDTAATAVSALGPGFHYALTVAASPGPPPAVAPPASGALRYPLLDGPSALSGYGVTVALSPLQPLDHAQCYIALKGTSPVRSAFRTLLDRAVLLAPRSADASRLVFNSGFAGARYLVPNGDFALSIDGAAEPTKYGLGNQLLCGLSGVEYIHFAPGDVLRFYCDQNAAVTVAVDADLAAPGNVSFGFAPTPAGALAAATTAYAMVLPANPAQPGSRQYYSEPDQAPFFATSSVSAVAQQLGYYGLSFAALPNDAGSPPYCFPLVPYSSFTPKPAGFDPRYLAGFEFQLLNPTRKSLVEIWAAKSLLSHTNQDGTVTAITPEGHAAAFVAGNWQSLRIAEAGSAIAVSFAAAAGQPQLPQALQDAFLTNQQFLVITSPANLGAFTWNVTMDGWPFRLDLSKNTTVGDYRNVLVFKSANASLSQLARHPEMWTRYADFNDAKGDPQGIFLSNWLVDYLAQAKALYDDGRGVVSLGDFCALIDDTTWNGFLALRVDIDPQGLPIEIEALLSGIDKSLFVAHHIGNEVNLVTQNGSAYALNSAMFGLVHYIDPTLGAQVDDLPAYIANPQPYDFKVLTLEAVFENAHLVHFGNKSLLTLNTLIGDAVVATSAAGDAGANTLVLIGAYNASAEPKYTFATAKGALTELYLASNALERIEIARTTMTVSAASPSGAQAPAAYLARFNMSGSLRTMADADFDLLSYDTLGFDNLGLDMHLVSGGGDRSFAPDVASMRLALVQNVGLDPNKPPGFASAGSNLVRLGGLLAQFPLQLTGFVIGTAGRAPDALGYRTLATTQPKGISPADLGSDPWYGLAFTLNLGGQGALGQNGGLSAQVLLAWTPGGAAVLPSVLPAMKIAGPGGVSLTFDIEGVIKFGAADLLLNRPKPTDAKTPEQFILMFESIAFTVLSFSFPPKGSTNVFVFGDSTGAQPGDVLKPTLGWFGGYLEQPAPAGKSGGR
jgi:hypothetical protein